MLEPRILRSQIEEGGPSLNQRTTRKLHDAVCCYVKRCSPTWNTCVLRETASRLVSYHIITGKSSHLFKRNITLSWSPLSLAMRLMPILCKMLLKFLYHLKLTKHATAFSKNMHPRLQSRCQMSCQRYVKIAIFRQLPLMQFQMKTMQYNSMNGAKSRNRTKGSPNFNPLSGTPLPLACTKSLLALGRV